MQFVNSVIRQKLHCNMGKVFMLQTAEQNLLGFPMIYHISPTKNRILTVCQIID